MVVGAGRGPLVKAAISAAAVLFLEIMHLYVNYDKKVQNRKVSIIIDVIFLLYFMLSLNMLFLSA